MTTVLLYKWQLKRCFVKRVANFNSGRYKLSEIKKEPGIFEKLFLLGGYDVGGQTDATDFVAAPVSTTGMQMNSNDVKSELLKNYEHVIEHYDGLRQKLVQRGEPPEGSYEKYVYDCVLKKPCKDLLIADVIYENKKNILCIGEGNLSFSALLQRNLPLCKVVATSMENETLLAKIYGKVFTKYLKMLEANGGIYIPNVNVETVDTQFLKNIFDVVIFNFPFVLPEEEFVRGKWKLQGNVKKGNKSDKDEYVKYYRKAEYLLLNKLIYQLFKSSSTLLRDQGYLHLRMNDKYITCHFPKEFNLSFVQRFDFYNAYSTIYKPMRYIPSMYNSSFFHPKKVGKKNVVFTSNGRVFKSFKMEHTSTLVFKKGGIGEGVSG
ncbi:conserved Plasmodium protein, unknown function [Plasmodium ovale wallikeri]|uniref:25S rRNA (uridine-N(3))-methyltransferase BMT5-like domain-containing protein n=1 Tax=Plasmodium ovale wallikeri TaxID=864142 RepID=A0A1A8YL99_PLAOA|nr:conserved Plasmodium protein, unknown function [Plasmodium ovale wallikeri]SBT32919.1 conserved Plasmodium protein, unknown function [Plasmodium ovale wallikeri]